MRCHNKSATVQPGHEATVRGQPGDLAGIDERRRIAVEGDDELVHFHPRMLPHPSYGRTMTNVEKQLSKHAQIAERIIGNIA